MFNDPEAEKLRAAAMTGAKNGEERIRNFIAYHEYVLSQVPFAPIYQPVTTVAYNKDRVTVPEAPDSPIFQQVAIMDMAPVE